HRRDRIVERPHPGAQRQTQTVGVQRHRQRQQLHQRVAVLALGERPQEREEAQVVTGEGGEERRDRAALGQVCPGHRDHRRLDVLPASLHRRLPAAPVCRGCDGRAGARPHLCCMPVDNRSSASAAGVEEAAMTTTSRSRGFTTLSLTLIPVAVAVNYVGGALARVLGLPLYLDSIGTVLAAMLAGPVVGAAAGAVNNVFLGLTVDATSF